MEPELEKTPRRREARNLVARIGSIAPLLFLAVALSLWAVDPVWAVDAVTDTDLDGVVDADDNCPAVPNGAAQDDQADRDGDGIGDACECGDANGDGHVDTFDARIIERCSGGEFACPELCDVSGEGSCTAVDAALVQKFAVAILVKADFICDQRPPGSLSLPRARFSTPSTSAEEGQQAPVMIEVIFSQPYTGDLVFAVDGTTDPSDRDLPGICSTGDDSVLRCRVSGVEDQTVAELPIELLDDLEIEELEWLSLRLESEHQGVGYELRDSFAHTVQIADNDAVWDGSFVSENEQIAFSMEILRQAGAVEASLRAHTGGLLAEVDPVAAPVTIQFTDVLFDAQTSAIPIPGSRTPSGSAMEIELSLHATPSTGLVSDTQVIGDTDMGSTTTLVLRTPGHPHLERTLAGSFALTRRAPRPNTTPPPLVSLGLAGGQ